MSKRKASYDLTFKLKAVKCAEEKTKEAAPRPDNPVPEDLLMSSDVYVLNNYLSKYIVETRKSNGEHYPPSTLASPITTFCMWDPEILYTREQNPECPNFLDKQDNRFKKIQGTLDAYSHKLRTLRWHWPTHKACQIQYQALKKTSCGKLVS